MFDRAGEGYAVTIYLPGEQRWSGRLSWVDGEAVLDADEGQVGLASKSSESSEPLAWALAEALKLARTLRRTPKQHMVRWRGPI